MSHWHLASINWLDTLPEKTIQDLRNSSRTQVYDDKETIFAPAQDPETVYLLEKGLTRIYRCSDSGEEFTLGFVEPGEVFGELAALSGDSRDSFAVAIDYCGVLKVPKRTFMELMQSTPDFSIAISKQVGRRLKRIETRAEDLIFRSAPSRVARMLLLLMDDFGKEMGSGIYISLHLTQGELATLVGCSRPTVNITINNFRERGVIDLDGGHIVVVDKRALGKIADATHRN